MKFANILIFICILSLLNSCQKVKNEPDSNIPNKNNSEKYIPDSFSMTWEKYIQNADILTTKFSSDFYSITFYEDYLNDKKKLARYSSSKDLFNNALRQYQENNINSALEYIESAIKTYPESIYYYHYGVFLMNIGDFENAEKAFNLAIPVLEKIVTQEKYPLYTFDNNGFPREIYLAYYNLACIYSINMDLDKSLEYLFYSIEHGYPYIDNLFSDVNLSNLLKSDNNIETLIRKKYQDGFKNVLTGKIFVQEYGVNDLGYYFVDDKNVKRHFPYSDIRKYILYGTYEVKNYHVYIHFNKETGLKGVIDTELEAAGDTMIYANYVDYSSDIDKNAVISIKDMIPLEEWKGIDLYTDIFLK